MNQTSHNHKQPVITAVVVTYLPDTDVLSKLLPTLVRQVSSVHVIDNTPTHDARVERCLGALSLERVSLTRMGSNRGIASALNAGIENAVRDGASHVLLSDQDSLPAPGMVDGLVEAWKAIEARGNRVASVGPMFTDRNTGITFPFQAIVQGKYFYGHATPDEEQPEVEAISLITSGMLVPVPVLDDVGLMREDFFIDYVDIEWCHRARAAGYRHFGTHRARMFHAMGDEGLRVWWFGWRRENAYSPDRVYYRVRNFISLCRMSSIKARWKVRQSWYLLGFLYTQVGYGNRRLRSMRLAARGLCDGLRKRMGPLRP